VLLRLLPLPPRLPPLDRLLLLLLSDPLRRLEVLRLFPPRVFLAIAFLLQ
jgi:hypothetical protein